MRLNTAHSQLSLINPNVIYIRVSQDIRVLEVDQSCLVELIVFVKLISFRAAIEKS
jgi:hypothetical protein